MNVYMKEQLTVNLIGESLKEYWRKDKCFTKLPLAEFVV